MRGRGLRIAKVSGEFTDTRAAGKGWIFTDSAAPTIWRQIYWNYWRIIFALLKRLN